MYRTRFGTIVKPGQRDYLTVLPQPVSHKVLPALTWSVGQMRERSVLSFLFFLLDHDIVRMLSHFRKAAATPTQDRCDSVAPWTCVEIRTGVSFLPACLGFPRSGILPVKQSVLWLSHGLTVVGRAVVRLERGRQRGASVMSVE